MKNSILLAAAAFAVASLVAVASSGPDTVTLRSKQGNITFSHIDHTKMTSCSVCHGDTIGKLAPLGRDKGHKMCLDCHKSEGAGPTRCTECHKR